MDTTELLKKVRKIEIKTKGLSKHIFSGEYHSAFKGRGMSFSEVREYQYGDDVRNIDWNVTARSDDTYIKVFEEERELTVMLLVDVSNSNIFGTVNQLKSEILTEIAAVIAFSAISNNDKVGAIFFSDKIDKYIPPKKGKKHILRIIREMLDLEDVNHLEEKQEEQKTSFWSKITSLFKPKEKNIATTNTNLSVALRFMNNVVKKRCTAFVLSDFLTKDYDDALRIVARRHDLIGLHIFDQSEQQLPDVGLVYAADAETGTSNWIDTSSRYERAKYENWYTDNFNYFKNSFQKSGADMISIKTDDDYVKELLKFFKRRHK